MLPYDDLSNMTAKEYTMYHESLMQDNHGSTAIHTFFCILATVQCTILACIIPKKNKNIQYVYEYSVLVLPLIFIHTVVPNFIYYFNYIMFTMVTTFIIHFQRTHPVVIRNNVTDDKIQSITCMRALTYLITVFCILAVDFNCFPRFLAKTEKHGYSLMDTGVGLFVLMSGLVHKEIHGQNRWVIVKGNIKFVLILVILGIVRLISVKKLNYQEHLTEYGVHWNFFITLAICKVLSTILLMCFNHAFILWLFTIIFHEIFLYNGLQEWVFNRTPRDSFISANKEGISSCLGYVSMYIFGVYLKKVLCDKSMDIRKKQVLLIVLSFSLWVMSCIVNIYRPTSRTLANAGYCTYLEAILVTVLTMLYYVEVSYENKLLFETPFILRDINTNGLLYFLAANVFTGAINLSIRTFMQTNYVSFAILNVYMVATLSFAVYLRKLGVRL